MAAFLFVCDWGFYLGVVYVNIDTDIVLVLYALPNRLPLRVCFDTFLGLL